MLLFLAMIESDTDRKKFEIIYTLYHRLMKKIVFNILHNNEDAEDVVQLAFMRIVDLIEKIYDAECLQTRSLIVLITENKAIDYYRKKQRTLKTIPLDVECDDYASNCAIEEAIDHADLLKSMAELPARYRSILLLKYAHGYSTSEIAVILEITEANSKKSLQRAKTAYREVLISKTVNQDPKDKEKSHV